MKWGGKSQGTSLYKSLTFHMILENSEMSVTLACAYLKEIHSICSRGSDNMTFQQQNNAITDIVMPYLASLSLNPCGPVGDQQSTRRPRNLFHPRNRVTSSNLV